MAAVCSICRHPERKAIDLALAAETGSLRAIAGRFHASKTSLQRHKAAHLHPATRRAAEKREELRPEGLLDELRDLQDRTIALLDRAVREKAKPADVARCIKEVRENIELMAKLTGAISTAGGTLIDNRTQILNLEGLTIDELRSLARLGDGDRRARNGGSIPLEDEVRPAIGDGVLEESRGSGLDRSQHGNGEGNGTAAEVVS